MATYSKQKHDCGFLRADGTTTVGLRLVRDKNGVPIWSEYDDEILARQSFTDAPDYSYLPPEKEIAIILDDFREGFGAKFYDSATPKRYYSSINCDARFPNKLIAGPLAATVTKPTLPSWLPITDGGLENWTGDELQSWTKTVTGTGALTKDTAVEREGTNCAKLAAVAGPGAVTIYQDVNSTNDYAGLAFTFTAYTRTDTADKIRIALDDGVTTTYSSYQASLNTWEQLTVTATMGLACTRVRVMVVFDETVNATTNTYCDGAMTLNFTAPTVGVSAARCEFNDNEYRSFGRVLAKLNTTTGASFDYVAYMPANITDMCAFNVSTTAYLVIALGDSTLLVTMTTAEVFAQSAAQYAYFLATTPSTICCMTQATTYLYSTTNPTGAWTSRGIIGQPYDYPTDLLVASDNTSIACKEDMPYYINSSWAAYPLMSSFKTLQASTSGVNSLQAFGNLYIQGGDQTLKEYEGTPGAATSIETNISPAIWANANAEFIGKIQGIAADDRYLYVSIDYGDYQELLAGNWETIDGNTDWRWHPIGQLTLTGCQTLAVSTVYKKRLWISSTSADDSIYYYPLTTKYGNITSDTDYLYQTGSTTGSLITPWLHGNLKGDNKAWIKVTLTLGHVYSAAIYFTVSYQKWGDDLSGGAGWTSIGNFDGTATNRIETLYLPVDSNSAKPVSPFMRFKIVPITNTSATTPVMERIDIRAIWRPTKRRIIACMVESKDDILLLDGQPNKDIGENIKIAIDEAADATWPVTFYDIDGNTIYVNFLQPVESQVTKDWEQGRKRHIERVYKLLLQKVQLS